MTWMDLDDKLLAHPKFLRAVEHGGSEAVHMWLGLRQYVAQNLTDGFIPGDMLKHVFGPAMRKRAAALEVLKKVGLVDEAPGGVALHDFLDWSRSRKQILADKERNRLRQERFRNGQTVSHAPVTPLLTPAVTPPSPLQSSPIQSEESSARASRPEPAPEPEPEPQLTICPLNLAEKPAIAHIIRDFVEKYRVTPEQLREAINEFVSYWTIGGGMGRKHANWPKKLREHLRRRCEEPGAIPAPGAAEHAARQPKRQRGGNASALAEVLPAPYHDAWKEPDWMKS